MTNVKNQKQQTIQKGDIVTDGIYTGKVEDTYHARTLRARVRILGDRIRYMWCDADKLSLV